MIKLSLLVKLDVHILWGGGGGGGGGHQLYGPMGTDVEPLKVVVLKTTRWLSETPHWEGFLMSDLQHSWGQEYCEVIFKTNKSLFN